MFEIQSPETWKVQKKFVLSIRKNASLKWDMKNKYESGEESVLCWQDVPVTVFYGNLAMKSMNILMKYNGVFFFAMYT